MLILSRKVSESVKIIIPPGLTKETIVNVMVVANARDDSSTRIGFDAPKEIKIHREEVWREIQREIQDLSEVTERAF